MSLDDAADIALVKSTGHFLADLLVEILRFLMAHPTHLCIVLCVCIFANAIEKIMAHARMTAVELKTIEERREAQEIEADRDVQVEASRARARVATAQIWIADGIVNKSATSPDNEAQAEAEAIVVAEKYEKRRAASNARR